MANRVVRERIDPRLTASLFANYRSAVDAILELVDNAIDSRVAGQPLRVELTVRPGTIALVMVGGKGMGPAELERDYLRWGGSRKRGGDQIGRYGQGGKAAVGYLGERFAIVASRPGEPRAVGFEDDTYRDRSRLRTYELHDRPKPVDTALGYVRIEIGGVDRPVDRRRLPARLAEVYRPLLVDGSVVLAVDRAPVTVAEPVLVERHDVRVRAGGRLVRGWYGLLPDPPPPGAVPGIRLYHLGRLVGAPEWFGHQGPTLHPGLGRLAGELELPHVPVTMNKSDVDRDSPAWADVERRLHALLAPLVRRLMRDEAARIVALPDAAFHEELERRFGLELGEIALAGPRRAYPLGFLLARSFIAPRLALVGDAAHVIHPIAGQGLNLGLKDAAALAEAVADAVRLGLDPGGAEVLETYERARRFDTLAMGVVTDGLNRLFSNDALPLRLARDLGLGLVDRLPALKRFFIREAAGLQGEAPRLMRGEAL